MNEFELINKYLKNNNYYSKDIILGIGDDASVIRNKNNDVIISTDMLVEGQHFFSNTSAKDLAYKVLSVNLSDMSAMGALPKFVLLSMGMPYLDSNWIDEFFDQFFAMLKLYNFSLIGGDITKSDKKIFNITIIGYSPFNNFLTRHQAELEDDIWVSGNLGLASAALDHHLGKVILNKDLFVKCEQKRLRPEPRINLGLELFKLANSAIDISDGFAQDLGHILDMSKVGANVYIDLLPTIDNLKNYSNYYNWVVCGGDDYELIFTSCHDNLDKILKLSRKLGIKLTRVGKINSSLECNFLDKHNNKVLFDKRGFDHFE